MRLSADQDANPGSIDFFISYTGADQGWAEWMAWTLEEAGYSTILQAWDFPSSSYFVHKMHEATQIARRTIAVLSHAYLDSAYAEAEWQEAWRNDPRGENGKLLVFRIEDCRRPGLLGQVVSDDLFGIDAETARSRVLIAARRGRRKPAIPPGFPAVGAPPRAVPFPGRLIPAAVQEAHAAGGPATADNPFGVAVAFWYIVLNESYEDLDVVITPESKGRWPLRDLRQATEGGGITSAVMKPCYDVAYVRIVRDLNDLGADPDASALVVSGGLLPTDAKIISMVLRPELGGWRVHGFGYPMDPSDLPRTWRLQTS